MTRQHRAGRTVVVPLPAEIDLINSKQVYDQLYATFTVGVAVVVADLTATWFCDCAALRRLLAIQQRAAAQGAEFRLVIPSGGPVRRLADLVDLDGHLCISPARRKPRPH